MDYKLVTVKKNQYRGYSQRWNFISFSEEVEIPKGKYFKNGKQLIVASKISDRKYSPSAKHGYLIK